MKHVYQPGEDDFERIIHFIVPGQPVGKARARVGRFRTYTPENTVNYENLVKSAAFDAMNGSAPMDGMLQVGITAYMQMPKASKKRTELMLSGDIRPAKKPDIDNIIKSALDALNGVAFLDDKQVVTLFARKYYSDTPRLEIAIKQWGAL